MEVGLSQSSSSCRLGKWISSVVALDQISYWNSEVTNLCLTSLAPEKLQTLPKRQLCKTWEVVQMCVSLEVKICDVLSTAKIDQMDQAP